MKYCTTLVLFPQRFPNHAKRVIKKGMLKEVASVMSEEEFEKHFSPPYNPLKQRFCLAPGGDFFAPIRWIKNHICVLTGQEGEGEHCDRAH